MLAQRFLTSVVIYKWSDHGSFGAILTVNSDSWTIAGCRRVWRLAVEDSWYPPRTMCLWRLRGSY